MALSQRKKIEIALASSFFHDNDYPADAETTMLILNTADCSLEELLEFGNLTNKELSDLYDITDSINTIQNKIKEKFSK